jgi:hypothetical protein
VEKLQNILSVLVFTTYFSALGSAWALNFILFNGIVSIDSLCGLVVTVPGYRSRGPGFDFRRCQIF